MPFIGAVIMYITVADHDMESCGSLIILSSIIEMLFVSGPQLFLLIR